MNYRRWTAEETDYLITNWGLVSMRVLMKNLKRTEISIRAKAVRLELGHTAFSGNYFTARQVAAILKISHNKVINWIKLFELKAKHSTLSKTRKFYLIQQEDLINWLRDNQHLWNAYNVSEYDLGTEPDWLKAKRAKDIAEYTNSDKRWTKQEDSLLIYGYKKGESFSKIAERLPGRTSRACEHRAKRLPELQIGGIK